ncbi:MAG TPA: hemolysin family protein, partial [Erysipelotrichaceae bacterium]|nr:hemolysin family protein [Erysipelotrichaceae bacterium]
MDDRLCRLVNFAVNSSNAVIIEDRESVFGYIILLIVLIALNAFFAASELAIVSFNDAKLEKLANEGNKKAKALYNLTVKPTKFLSTIQIGVTLSGFLSSAVAADTFADYIVYWLRDLQIPSSTVRLVSIFGITLILSFVTLVFGELLPKRIAMKDPEKISFAVVGPISFFYSVLKPLVWVVSKTVDAIANSLGIKESDGQQEFTEEEIRIMVDAGTEKGFIEYDEKKMIDNIFDFNDRTVGEIMTHRTDMVSLSIEADLDTVVKTFLETGYSRIPVYDEDIDDIEGIIYLKDLLKLLAADSRHDFRVSDFLRKVMFVYENMKCDELLPLFQKQKIHIAIVLDEYGGTYGIVTMEDLLEFIVGNIQDEYDDEEEEITEIKENHYI